MGKATYVLMAIAFWAASIAVTAQGIPERSPDNPHATVGERDASPGLAGPSTYSAELLPTPEPAAYGAVFHYPRTDYPSIIDTNGWPVPTPFNYYPQGPVNEDGSGIYQCLVPPDPVEQCFCTPPPCYFGVLYVEGVILDRRSSLERMSLIFDNTGSEVLNTGDLELPMEAGFRLGFYLCDPCGIDWNVDYFSVQNFQTAVTRADALGVTDSFFGFTNGPVPSLTAEYESNLDSLEFTVRARQWRRVAPLVGVRFLQVDEQFNSLADPVAQTGSFSRADNELYGLQLGLQALIYEGPTWRLETTVKAGPYYNDIDLEASVTPPAAATDRQRLDPTTVAFAGDLRVGWVCQLGPRANFRIGYRALWLDGIALAPNQNNNLSFSTNLQTVDLSGVLYQGGDLGFEWTW